MLRYAFSICTDPDYNKEILSIYDNNKYIHCTFWGNEPFPEEFWHSLMSNSLFSKAKMLLIRNAHKIHKEDYKTITQALASNNDIFCIFSIEQENIPQYILNSNFYNKAVQEKHVHKQQVLTRKTIAHYIQQYCHKHGYTIEQKALLYIKDILPCHLSAIHNECKKYMLYADSTLITFENILLNTSYTTEHTVWQYIENLLRGGNITNLWNSIQEGSSFFSISSLLQRELRILTALRSGDSINLAPFILKQKESLAKQYSYHHLTKLFSLLLTMERAIKSGDITEQQALDYTICTIPYLLQKNCYSL